MATAMRRAALLALFALSASRDAPAACSAGASAGCPANDEVGLLQTRNSHATALAPTATSKPDDDDDTAGETEQWGGLTEPLVHAVYTFGAPATKSQPFRNAATADGCFPGLRSYTEDLLGAFHEIHQVDAAAMNNYYPHARIASVVLRSGEDSIYTPCNAESDGHPDWPQRGASVFEEWRIHVEDAYVSRLNDLRLDGKPAVDEEPFKTARFFSQLAWNSYDDMGPAKESIAKNMPGWVMVERADDHYSNDDDPVMIIQDSSSLDCAIVFTGTNDASELSTSTTQYTTGYCGFPDVHVGYRNELWSISDHIFQYLKPKLQQCKQVTCVGHSLAGALCEIFAACANSGHFFDPDYRRLAWKQGEPRRLQEANETDFHYNRAQSPGNSTRTSSPGGSNTPTAPLDAAGDP